MTYIYDSFMWTHCDDAYDGDVNRILLEFYSGSGYINDDDGAAEDDATAAYPSSPLSVHRLTPFDVVFVVMLICLAVGLNWVYYRTHKKDASKYYNISTKKNNSPAYSTITTHDDAEELPILAMGAPMRPAEEAPLLYQVDSTNNFDF